MQYHIILQIIYKIICNIIINLYNFHMKENKKLRFQRLAMNRVNKTIKSIELIGNLGNKSLYESTPDERRKIIKAINNATNQMKIDLEGSTKKKEGFKFD